MEVCDPPDSRCSCLSRQRPMAHIKARRAHRSAHWPPLLAAHGEIRTRQLQMRNTNNTRPNPTTQGRHCSFLGLHHFSHSEHLAERCAIDHRMAHRTRTPALRRPDAAHSSIQPQLASDADNCASHLHPCNVRAEAFPGFRLGRRSLATGTGTQTNTLDVGIPFSRQASGMTHSGA